MAAVILLLAVFMTVKYFPGFENEPAYAGSAFQSIYPDAFAGDPYMGPEKPFTSRPFQLSLLYVIIHFTGEIWLDDRFTALVYVGLVFAGLLGVERIAAHLGLVNPWARLAVLLLLMKDHQIFDKNLLAHHVDINHFAFAVPLVIWLLYAVLARKGWPVILALCAVLALVSPRVGAYPVFMALCAYAWTGGARDRIITAVLFTAAAVTAYAGLFHIFPTPEEHRLALWDIIRAREHGTGNPWHGMNADMVLKNLLWLAHVCGGLWLCVRLRGEEGGRFTAAGVVLGASLAVWLTAGLYISTAPDALKQPLLIALAASRALGWAQLLATAVIAAVVLNRAEKDCTPRALLAAALVITALYMTGPGDPVLWSAVLLAAAVTAAVIVVWRARRNAPGAEPAPGARRALAARPVAFIAAALVLSNSVSYGAAAVRNWPDWRTWAEHGIYGAAASAVWIGVDDHIRANTPPDASVLPYYFDNGALRTDRSFGTRTGRAMPVPEDYSQVMNPGAFKFQSGQSVLVENIAADLRAGAAAAAHMRIKQLVPVPDYIVAPAAVVSGMDWAALGYAPDAETHGFMILRRNL